MIVLAVFLSGAAWVAAAGNQGKETKAKETKGKAQAKCPVLGGNIDKSVFTDYEGKRIYFCCAGCIDKFKKDPKKYMKILKDQGVEPEKAPKRQEKCPITGEKINKKIFADYQGKRVYFCCTDCKQKFLKSPKKYIDKLEAAGIDLCADGKCPGCKKGEKGEKCGGHGEGKGEGDGDGHQHGKH